MIPAKTKNIILIMILIVIIAISSAVRAEIQARKVMIYYENALNADYEQIALTFLAATHDPIPR